MSNFTRRINDFLEMNDRLSTNSFLHKVNEELVKNGRAFLAFRNNVATIYYNGNQLCNLAGADGYHPSVYNHYLPVIRSQTLGKDRRKENFSESTWLRESNLNNASFASVYGEILDNIKKEESPESLQASRFYRFSPLNQAEEHEIVLLDIEAAFSETGVKTDRIDLVFYHTTKRQLMFIEVKRLADQRLLPQKDSHGKPIADAEVLGQLKRYDDRCKNKACEINAEYNRVISYYNALSGRNMAPIEENSVPLLGLLLVEFTRKTDDQNRKKQVQDMLKANNFKWYAVGNTSSVTPATLTAIYNAIK